MPLLFVLAAGCGWSRNQGTVADPLLVSRKPVEAEAVLAPPVQFVYSEPTAPLHPYVAAFAAQKQQEDKEKSRPGVLTSTPNDN